MARQKFRDLLDKSALNKSNQENFNLELTKIIETKENNWINSLCFLKDRRLVSSDWDKKITVHHKENYEASTIIKNPHEDDSG